MRIYPRGNSVVVDGLGFKDQDGNLVTGASVVAEVAFSDGSAIEGLDNPLSMSDEGEGNYTVTVPALDVPDGTDLRVTVRATIGDVKGRWSEIFVVRERAFSASC